MPFPIPDDFTNRGAYFYSGSTKSIVSAPVFYGSINCVKTDAGDCTSQNLVHVGSAFTLKSESNCKVVDCGVVTLKVLKVGASAAELKAAIDELWTTYLLDKL